MKNMYGMNLSDIRVLLKALQNYPIEDNERFQTMNRIQAIEDMICDSEIKDEVHEDVSEQEVIAAIDISELKRAMSGCK